VKYPRSLFAEKLVHWEPMNHEQKLALQVKERTKPAGGVPA